MADRKKRRRRWLYVPGVIILLILIFIIWFNAVTRISPPTEMDPLSMGYERQAVGPNHFVSGSNRLLMNDHGLWELYIRGDAFEMGIVNGLLCSELIRSQEDAFVDQIRVMVPSERWLRFLKYFIAWFNRNLDSHIRQEYLLEIYGLSAFASDNYGFIGPNYNRILNYHAAHDIGHALQNMNLVECTAFGLWDERSAGGELLIGRNFDFYVGDEFARNKIIVFAAPENGYKYASISWAGMTGVVSGMNEKGLTLSLNSAKSDIPYGARTPVSIIGREILQYASNIEEALAIAEKRGSFVSESFLVGSAADHKVVVIEKTPDITALYDPDTNFIILTNHFQSEILKNDPLNRENLENETSLYRYRRVEELLSVARQSNPDDAAGILRDTKGIGGDDIGLGNEKAINQLIAHHSVIFEPAARRMWVSTAPWQLGNYLCYDLDTAFAYFGKRAEGHANYLEELSIPADPFLETNAYARFIEYRALLVEFQQAVKEGRQMDDEDAKVAQFILSNPGFFLVHDVLGQYYQELDRCEPALHHYRKALTLETASAGERQKIMQRMELCSHE
jgi:isopenicillin-N N-acyltransferase like protein